MPQRNLDLKVKEFVRPIKTMVNVDQTVDDALARIRNHQVDEKIFYFYVVDEEGHLKGVVSTRNLLISHGTKKIHEILEDRLVSIREEHTLQHAMEMLNSHRLLALPVVDERNRFLGTIDIQLYFEEAVDVAQSKRNSTDLFQLLGLSLEEGKPTSAWSTYKHRMPWIFCNMFGGIACAIISKIFELVLLEVILLALFIPLVLSLSESISMQSMSYSLQLLHRPKPSLRRMWHRLFAESKMALFLALTCGLVVGALSICWGDGIPPALAIAAGIILSVTITGTIGAAVPLILHSMKLDPKVAAGPVVLMLADIITTTLYLGLSTLWLLHR